MLGTGVMTVEAIKCLANQFLDKKDAEIDELPEPGTFYLSSRSSMEYVIELVRALAEMSPAHLAFGFRFIREVDTAIHFGAYAGLHRKYVASPKRPQGAEILEKIYVASMPVLHRRIEAQPVRPHDATVEAAACMSAKPLTHRRIAAGPQFVPHNEARATPYAGGKAGIHIKVKA